MKKLVSTTNMGNHYNSGTNSYTHVKGTYRLTFLIYPAYLSRFNKGNIKISIRKHVSQIIIRLVHQLTSQILLKYFSALQDLLHISSLN